MPSRRAAGGPSGKTVKTASCAREVFRSFTFVTQLQVNLCCTRVCVGGERGQRPQGGYDVATQGGESRHQRCLLSPCLTLPPTPTPSCGQSRLTLLPRDGRQRTPIAKAWILGCLLLKTAVVTQRLCPQPVMPEEVLGGAVRGSPPLDIFSPSSAQFMLTARLTMMALHL